MTIHVKFLRHFCNSVKIGPVIRYLYPSAAYPVMITTVDINVVAIAIAMFAKFGLDELWSHIVRRNIIDVYQFIVFLLSLIKRSQAASPSSMHLQAATKCCIFLDGMVNHGTTIRLSTKLSSNSLVDRIKIFCETVLAKLERIVFFVYQSTTEVDDCRRQPFLKNGGPMERLPPNSSCSTSIYSACILPSRVYMESIFYSIPHATIANGMGLASRTSRFY